MKGKPEPVTQSKLNLGFFSTQLSNAVYKIYNVQSTIIVLIVSKIRLHVASEQFHLIAFEHLLTVLTFFVLALDNQMPSLSSWLAGW